MFEVDCAEVAVVEEEVAKDEDEDEDDVGKLTPSKDGRKMAGMLMQLFHRGAELHLL